VVWHWAKGRMIAGSSPGRGSGAHQASYPMGTRESFPGVKAAGSEVDH
jgi:hypothetical protein